MQANLGENPMRKLALISLSMATFLSVTYANSASAMTLNQAWQATKKNDPSYQSAMLDEQASALGVQAQKSELMPSLSASVGYTWQKQWQDGESASGHSNAYQIGLSQTLWDSQKWDRLSTAQSQWLSSQLARSASDNALAQKLCLAYMAVGQAKSNLALAEKQYAQGNKLLSITQRRYDAGQLMSTALTAMKANVWSEKSQILSANAALISAQTQLSALVGTTSMSVQPVSISPLNSPPSLSRTGVDEWWIWAKNHSPALLNAAQQIKTAETQWQTSKAGYLPTITGNVGYGGSFRAGTSRGLNAGINVNVPLDLNGATRTQVDLAQVGVEQAKNHYRSVSLSIKQTVTNQVQEVALDWQRVELEKHVVDSQKQALHSQEVIYRAGMGSATDVIQAHNALYSGQNQLLSLVYQYWGDRVTLLSATGQLTDAEMARLSKALSA